MKILDMVIDGFWIIVLLWSILYLWVWSGIPSPLIVKDILYAISVPMDYWFYINGVLGTIRLVLKFINK